MNYGVQSGSGEDVTEEQKQAEYYNYYQVCKYYMEILWGMGTGYRQNKCSIFMCFQIYQKICFFHASIPALNNLEIITINSSCKQAINSS